MNDHYYSLENVFYNLDNKFKINHLVPYNAINTIDNIKQCLKNRLVSPKKKKYHSPIKAKLHTLIRQPVISNYKYKLTSNCDSFVVFDNNECKYINYNNSSH